MPLTYREGMSVTQMPKAGPVDWAFAKSAGTRLVPAGPKVSPDEAAGVVSAIRSAATSARGPVAE